jgi:hypothetical protein
MKELKFLTEYPNYKIDKFGNIFNLKDKQLKLVKSKRGYLEVNLYNQGKCTLKAVHRLVAIHFISNPENKPQVNHIDGNKLNNCVNNLEWCTNSENQKHAYKLKLQPSKEGEANSNTDLTNAQVDFIKQKYNSGMRISEISKELEIALSIIRNIIYGFSWKCNKVCISKRDDRKIKTKDSIFKMLDTREKVNSKCKGIKLLQKNEIGAIINTFTSINNASIFTKIPRKTIEAVVHCKKFYNKDKTKFYTIKQAGGFLWEKM